MRSSRSFADRILALGLRGSALVTGGVVVLIFAYLLFESWPALRAVGVARFTSDEAWRPVAGADQEYGLRALIAGSLAATIGSILIAAPLGILSALFAKLYAPAALGRWFMRLIAVFAGVPSVVFGLWGLTTLAPLVRAIEPPGTSLLTAILILALMTIPTIALLSATAIERVQDEHLQGARALSLSRAAILTGVVWPSARSGFVVAALFGVTRAVGETMAVLMVAGNVARVPQSFLDPVRTLTANIALELGYATDAHRSALFVTGLALLLLIAALVFLSRRFARGLSDA